MDAGSKLIGAAWRMGARRLSPFYLETVAGVQWIPQDGPFVLVANHVSAADAMLLLGICHAVRDDRPAALSKLSGFTGWRSMFYQAIGGLSFGHKQESERARRMVEAVLADGHPLLIFPEGTRGTGERMLPFKDGAFSLASRLDLPVVPAAVTGTAQILPKGKIVPRPFWSYRARIAFGPLIEPDQTLPRRKRTLALRGGSRASIEEMLAMLGGGNLDLSQDARLLADQAADLVSQLARGQRGGEGTWQRIWFLFALMCVNDPEVVDHGVVRAALRLLRAVTVPWAGPRLAVWTHPRSVRKLQRVQPTDPEWLIASSVLRRARLTVPEVRAS